MVINIDVLEAGQKPPASLVLPLRDGREALQMMSSHAVALKARVDEHHETEKSVPMREQG